MGIVDRVDLSKEVGHVDEVFLLGLVGVGHFRDHVLHEGDEAFLVLAEVGIAEGGLGGGGVWSGEEGDVEFPESRVGQGAYGGEIGEGAGADDEDDESG